MLLSALILRLSIAFLLGVIIGLERQWRQRMAGLRTNTLVATGSALFVMLSVMTLHDASPSRVAAQVVSGIGFLGAGVIMRDGLSIRGLNTAATLWCSAAIGCMTGAGFLAEAAIGAVFILLSNILLRPLAQKMNMHSASAAEEEVQYSIVAICQAENESHVRTSLLHMAGQEKLALHSLHSEDLDGQPKVKVEACLVSLGRADTVIERIVSHLSLEEGITAIRWEIVPGDPA